MPRARVYLHVLHLVHVVNEVPILRLNFVRRSGIQNFAKLRPVCTDAQRSAHWPAAMSVEELPSSLSKESRERPRHPSHARRADG